MSQSDPPAEPGAKSQRRSGRRLSEGGSVSNFQVLNRAHRPAGRACSRQSATGGRNSRGEGPAGADGRVRHRRANARLSAAGPAAVRSPGIAHGCDRTPSTARSTCSKGE